MTIKDILVYLEANAPCEARLALAATLAERDGAEVTVAAIRPEPTIDFAYDYAIGPQAVGEAIEARRIAIETALAGTEAAYRAYAAVGPGEWRWAPVPVGASAATASLQARAFDIALLRRPEPGDSFGRALAEAAVLASGTACILVPEPESGAPRLDHLVLAWNGAREAKRALDAGLGLLERARRVTVAMTSEIPPERLNESELMRHLARHGIDAEPHPIAAGRENAGEALLTACADLQADMLVMGAYGHARTTELILGGATRTVLAEASLPVLMAH